MNTPTEPPIKTCRSIGRADRRQRALRLLGLSSKGIFPFPTAPMKKRVAKRARPHAARTSGDTADGPGNVRGL